MIKNLIVKISGQMLTIALGNSNVTIRIFKTECYAESSKILNIKGKSLNKEYKLELEL